MESSGNMAHSKHIWRAFFILLMALVCMTTVRHFLIPPSFGKAGHFRYDSIQEFMEQPVVHGGKPSCLSKTCHDAKGDGAAKSVHAAVGDELAKGKHAVVSCEVCHDVLARHVKDGQKIADMPKSPSYRLCAHCHRKLPARPTTFPQVDFQAHLEEQGLPKGTKAPERICVKCHTPHNPAAE